MREKHLKIVIRAQTQTPGSGSTLWESFCGESGHVVSRVGGRRKAEKKFGKVHKKRKRGKEEGAPPNGKKTSLVKNGRWSRVFNSLSESATLLSSLSQLPFNAARY